MLRSRITFSLYTISIFLLVGSLIFDMLSNNFIGISNLIFIGVLLQNSYRAYMEISDIKAIIYLTPKSAGFWVGGLLIFLSLPNLYFNSHLSISFFSTFFIWFIVGTLCILGGIIYEEIPKDEDFDEFIEEWFGAEAAEKFREVNKYKRED